MAMQSQEFENYLACIDAKSRFKVSRKDQCKQLRNANFNILQFTPCIPYCKKILFLFEMDFFRLDIINQ